MTLAVVTVALVCGLYAVLAQLRRGIVVNFHLDAYEPPEGRRDDDGEAEGAGCADCVGGGPCECSDCRGGPLGDGEWDREIGYVRCRD